MDVAHRKKMAVITLGCQMNKHDSERIAGLMAGRCEITRDHDQADVLFINTCAVRDKAEQKFFSLLGRLKVLKRRNKNLVIGVAGCVAQDLGRTIIDREPMVDIVLGARALDSAPELLDRFLETGEPQVDTTDNAGLGAYPMIRESKTSAWVSIMRGCDNHCSYCIVPGVRGPEVSRAPEAIVTEVRELAERGRREVTLLGQNVNSYGRGLDTGVDFAGLLEQVSSVDGIRRVRFVTSHPKDLSDRLIDAMARLPGVCPALHLPIQSGSDRILALMNRGYTTRHYFERVDRLRREVPGLSLTSDVIVGFPGETGEDFEATRRAVERAGYDNLFLFKFSPRRGTRAADLPDSVDPAEVSERFGRIESIQKDITRRRYATWIGKCEEALVEGPSKKNPDRYSGRTAHNLIVHFVSDNDYTGQFIHVNIESAGRYSLAGSVSAAVS